MFARSGLYGFGEPVEPKALFLRIGLRSIAAPPLETGAAQDGPSQVRQERNGGGSAALRAGDGGFDTPVRIGMLRLALLAMSRLMLELLFLEEKLLARAEDELLPAIDAFQYPVGEFHPSTSPGKGTATPFGYIERVGAFRNFVE